MALEIRRDNEPPAGFLPSALRRVSPVTLELFRPNSAASFPVELDQTYPRAIGWKRLLDLKTGSIFFRDELCAMNGKNKQRGNYKLDLKLNLSPPKDGDNLPPLSSPSSYFSSSSSGNSPPSSCITYDHNSENRRGSDGDQNQGLRYSNSPEGTSLVLVGCPRCLMYVMLSEDDPKCPKCKSTCLLDFQDETNKKTTRDHF